MGYQIEVAFDMRIVGSMTELYEDFVRKAEKILKQLESLRTKESNTEAITGESDMQLSFFKLDDPILEELREEIKMLDVNTLTPVEALMKLNEIKKLLGK